MGCCSSKADPVVEETTVESSGSKAIDKQIRKEEMKISREIKILLLGAGESGKSTILKQMKLVYGVGFTKEYVLDHRSHVYTNIYECAKSLVKGCEQLRITIQNSDNLVFSQQLMTQPTFDPEHISETLVKIEQLWSDPGIKEAFSRSNEFQIGDSTEYFMENIVRYKDVEFVPTEYDVLRTRVATSGITENFFNIDRNVFRIVDVGGQRSERKKWLSCFHDVTCVLFVVSISEFDQVLFEDSRTNRILESLQLFKDICENRWFTNTPIILFLNKKDIFQRKIESGKDIRIAFPEYEGQNSFEDATSYIEKQFLSFNKHPTREIFVKISCATDTNYMRYALNAVKVIIIQKKLETAGF